jgi:hypothetical protein
MRTKKVKPPPKKFEYVLDISKEFDDVTKKEFISFKFRTTKEFLMFKYRLTVDAELSDGTIKFNIIGFTPPSGDLSNPGFAEYEYRLYNFRAGEYSVVVERKETDRIKFKLGLEKSETEPIALRGIPRKSFIEIRR